MQYSMRPARLWHARHRSGCTPLPSGRSRSATVQVAANVRARWCIDARYGCKTELVGLLQEWVRDVGSKAGLDAQNTRLSTGAIGAPESRLEMEVSFSSTSDWEAFLARIPGQEHLAWSQRAQRMVVDGSPRWEVYRALTVPLAGDAAQPAVQPAAVPSTAQFTFFPDATSSSSSKAQPVRSPPQVRSSGLMLPEPGMDLDQLAGEAGSNGGSSSSGSSNVSSSSSSSSSPPSGDAPLLDWKGEPMVINPGDKLPFKFL